MSSRRTFIKRASLTACCGYLVGLNRAAIAEPLGLPLGLQLYSVREQLKTDVPGTLAELGKIGYREVEAAGFYGLSAMEAKQAMQAAGLRCVSAHYPMGQLQQHFDDILAYNKQLGTDYVICSSPALRNPPAAGTHGSHAMTMDDWRWNADQFNEMGTKVKAAGLGFGYHNHFHEFAPIEGGVPYEELMRRSDAAAVSFELDCGWAAVAGVSPVTVLRDHPHRIVMLHVKDFKLPEHPSLETAEQAKVTEMGMGSIDYAPVFSQAAKTQTIKHVFVEQEAFDMPWIQSLETDARYLKKM